MVQISSSRGSDALNDESGFIKALETKIVHAKVTRALRRDLGDLLSIHPTVKPVQLVADAIMDCSKRGERILDVFCGSGTTLIAAEKTGRIGFGLEIEPKYVDATLRRFRAMTGKEPVRESDGATLKELE